MKIFSVYVNKLNFYNLMPFTTEILNEIFTSNTWLGTQKYNTNFLIPNRKLNMITQVFWHRILKNTVLGLIQLYRQHFFQSATLLESVNEFRSLTLIWKAVWFWRWLATSMPIWFSTSTAFIYGIIKVIAKTISASFCIHFLLTYKTNIQTLKTIQTFKLMKAVSCWCWQKYQNRRNFTNLSVKSYKIPKFFFQQELAKTIDNTICKFLKHKK